MFSSGRVWSRNPVPTPPAGACIVDAATRHQAIDGFGASHYDPVRYQSGWSANADALWHPQKGIGLSIYNCAIAVDGNGHVGPLYQLDDWTAQTLGDWSQEIQAWNRGVRDFCVRVWTYQFASPYTWQVGNANNPNAALDTAHSTDAANAIATFLTNAVNNGVYFKYISPWNEPDISPSYPQIAWSTAQMLAFIKVLQPILVTWAATAAGQLWQNVTGLSVPYMIWGESFDFANQVGTYIPAAEGDATVVAYPNLIYANHQYNGGGVSAPPNPCSHKQWMTECSTQSTAWDVTMTDAMAVMSMLYNALTTGNVSAWLFWWAEADNHETDNEGLLGFATESQANWNAPDYTKRLYCMGNFSKFVRSGSTRIDVSNAPAGVNILAFRINGKDGYVAIVCINTNTSSTPVTFFVKNVECLQVTPYITDASNNCAPQSPIALSQQSFSATLTATSVTTFVY